MSAGPPSQGDVTSTRRMRSSPARGPVPLHVARSVSEVTSHSAPSGATSTVRIRPCSRRPGEAWSHLSALPRGEPARARLRSAEEQARLRVDLGVVVDRLWGAC